MKFLADTFIFSAVLFIVGCSAATVKNPGTDTLSAYLRAVEADDPDAAYSLMGEEYKKKVSREEYGKRWKAYREEMLEHVGIARESMQDDEKLSVEARLRFKTGRKTDLVWDQGKSEWRMKGGDGTDFAGAGPKSAVLALIRAVEQKDFNTFLNLLSSKRRKALLQAIFDRLERLKANLDRPVEQRGKRVRFQYDSRHYIDFVEEDGQWKIHDFN